MTCTNCKIVGADAPRKTKFKDCCIDCGKKKYKTKLKSGITVHLGYCSFCKKENSIIVPAADWAGKGD